MPALSLVGGRCSSSPSEVRGESGLSLATGRECDWSWTDESFSFCFSVAAFSAFPVSSVIPSSLAFRNLIGSRV